jgi:hypothetical protein
VKVADLLDLVYEALEDWPGGYKGEYVHTREGYLMGLDLARYGGSPTTTEPKPSWARSLDSVSHVPPR